jgi:hypothetical protein
MHNSDEEYYELTTPQKINQKKGRMEELALGILPRKSNVAGFIPTDSSTASTGSENHLASFRFQNTFLLNV